MKILKIILLISLFIPNQIDAQFFPIENEGSLDGPICIPPKPLPPLLTELNIDNCSTQLVVDLVTAYEVDDEVYFNVIYNEDAFEIFEFYELQILTSMCNSIQALGSNIVKCPIGWEKLPHPPIEEGPICVTVPKMRVMFKCNGKDYFSNEFTVEDTICLGEFRRKINENRITISPQPAIDFINIKSNLPINHVNIHNLNGKIIKEVNKISSNKIDLGNLAGGVYIARILTEDGITHHKKFLIQN